MARERLRLALPICLALGLATGGVADDLGWLGAGRSAPPSPAAAAPVVSVPTMPAPESPAEEVVPARPREWHCGTDASRRTHLLPGLEVRLAAAVAELSPGADPLSLVRVTEAPEAAARARDEAQRQMRFHRWILALPSWLAAYQAGWDELEVREGLARCYLQDERPMHSLPQLAILLTGAPDDVEYWIWAGKSFSLLQDTMWEIQCYLAAIELDPDNGEAHFMLALAYDKVDNSPKVLEHAQKAIRIDPEYKEKLKPRIKDSNVSKKIGRIVTRVLEDSKYERLTDESIEGYAEEIGRILGEENLDTERSPAPTSTRNRIFPVPPRVPAKRTPAE